MKRGILCNVANLRRGAVRCIAPHVKGALARACQSLFTFLIAGVTLASPDSPYPGSPPGFEEHAIFTAGTDGYLFYRIPAAAVTTKGTLLVFCEGRRTPWGPHNDSGEINVLLKRSTDGGKTFSPQKVIWADGPNTCGNPTAIVDHETGAIVLAMCHNGGEDPREADRKAAIRSGRTVWITRSEDDGQTWSPPIEITQDVKKPGWAWYATGPGIGIQLERGSHRGRLVVPCNHTEAGESFSHAIYSDDHGKTWHLGGTEPVGEGNESAIVERTDGSLMLNMRNAKAKGSALHHERAIAVSNDGGETFTDFHRDPALLDPICQGSILRYSWPADGDAKSVILFANPASATERTTMTVRLSYDDGKTWPAGQLVNKGWSCYSSLVTLPGGDVGLAYEAGSRARYETITFARMSMAWLTRAQDQTKLP